MKYNAQKLLEKLQSVQPGLTTKDIIEQTSNFSFTGEHLQTFNTEIACSVPLKVDFTCSVPAQPLLTTLQKFETNKEVELQCSESELVIRAGRKSAGITVDPNVIAYHDQLQLPKQWHSIPEGIGEAIKLTSGCTHKDEDRFPLTRVHLHPEFVEACDGDQLARYRIKLPLKKSIVVHKDAVKHIIPMGMTKMGVTADWLHFKNSVGLVFSCRCTSVEGGFPDLSEFLQVKGKKITLPKGFIKAAARAEIFSSQNPDDQDVTVEIRQGVSRVTGQGASGWFKETVPIPTYRGAAFSFRIKPQVLSEVVEKYNECLVAETRMKVKGSNFVYVASLGQVS